MGLFNGLVCGEENGGGEPPLLLSDRPDGGRRRRRERNMAAYEGSSMQDSSGITAVSIPVSEILVIGFIVLVAAVLAYWIVRRVRR
jgi:hypothetical protein